MTVDEAIKQLQSMRTTIGGSALVAMAANPDGSDCTQVLELTWDYFEVRQNGNIEPVETLENNTPAKLDASMCAVFVPREYT